MCFPGLREKKLLPPKTQVDPATLSEAELEKKEAKRYPASVSEAISEFHADASFKSLFTEGEDLVHACAVLKGSCLCSVV